MKSGYSKYTKKNNIFFLIKLYYVKGGSGDISGLFSKSWFQGIVVVVQHALQYNG